jgi:D-glycero-D-manno-heptose 1,7-bisphosphate phosphatase
MKRAIFLDRDGVINKLVYNPKTKEYQPPLRERDLKFFLGVSWALKKLGNMGFLLFLVSNQPDYAKGKASLRTLQAIHKKFHNCLRERGIRFRRYYYCYHHPKGRVPGYSCVCKCRKPKPFFLLKAKQAYGLRMRHSWLVGDRDSDILCGKRAGVKTVLIDALGAARSRGKAAPDFCARNLKEAVRIISHATP